MFYSQELLERKWFDLSRRKVPTYDIQPSPLFFPTDSTTVNVLLFIFRLSLKVDRLKSSVIYVNDTQIIKLVLKLLLRLIELM